MVQRVRMFVNRRAAWGPIQRQRGRAGRLDAADRRDSKGSPCFGFYLEEVTYYSPGLPGFAGYPGNAFSQMDFNPEGVAPSGRSCCVTPSGYKTNRRGRLPRVREARPWAVLCNTFGVKKWRSRSRVWRMARG